MITLKQVDHYPDTNSVEATWIDEEGIQARCHSYADSQMDMLRADLGADASKYATMIALVESLIVPCPLFTEPPITVSPRQIRQALTAIGLRARIEDAIAAADQDTKDWYEFATAFEENHPAVLALAAVLGISAEQVHALFVKAASL